ncbi:hypothetical protein K432DRAFT_428373 [Lepidopterella palustris CBS 459.81]|uniref:Ubiquitin-like domain-containing protein n=1 Tax=Lepidopterella palustris CBS 459.81 TaxID=1314670 RepID=A0A8E2E3W1_9PEZI|nr:hypothetical protein K432DRAFT_428373 [Lepidopterella palustris CBS 459.81]
MPVPFGVSVGDFITFIETVVTVINALHDSTGSAAEYRGVIRELESLKTSLKSLDSLDIANEEQKAALKFVAANAEQTIVEFLMEDGHRKIQWSLYSKDDVRKFQAQLQSHTVSLNILISQVHMLSTTAGHKDTQTALTRIESKIDQERAARAVAQAMILAALARCWKDLRDIMALIIMANFRIFDAILGSRNIARQVEYGSPVTFEDAHGRLFPINIQWLDTWEHFETALKWKFSKVPGLNKIEAGEYVLHDALSGRDIVRTQPIEHSLRPGRRVNMSVIFKLQMNKQALCPKCGSPVLETLRTDNHSGQCGLWYRRVELPQERLQERGRVAEIKLQVNKQALCPNCGSPVLETLRNDNHSGQCGFRYRRVELPQERLQEPGRVAEIEEITLDGDASHNPVSRPVPGPDPLTAPPDQISDFAHVRILSIPEVKDWDRINQELAVL